MEFLVELLEENTLFEQPVRGILNHVHIPALGYNLVFDHAAVANQRINAIRRHHRHRIAVVYSSCRVLVHLGTCSE